MIVDSHCHLDYSNLYDQLDDVIKRAVLIARRKALVLNC